MIRPPEYPDAYADPRLFVVHPVLWPELVAWLDARGIDLVRMPTDPDDLRTYAASPRDIGRPS